MEKCFRSSKTFLGEDSGTGSNIQVKFGNYNGVSAIYEEYL